MTLTNKEQLVLPCVSELSSSQARYCLSLGIASVTHVWHSATLRDFCCTLVRTGLLSRNRLGTLFRLNKPFSTCRAANSCAMAGTECPICSRTFASESIEEHAATCVGEEDDGSRVSPADEEVPTSAGPIGAPGPAAGAGADVGDVYVGTAGYNYTHWRKGAFYPRGLSQSNELKHYSGVFSAVEINASFHGGVYVAPLCPFTRVHFSQLASNNKQHAVDFI